MTPPAFRMSQIRGGRRSGHLIVDGLPAEEVERSHHVENSGRSIVRPSSVRFAAGCDPRFSPHK